MTAAERGRRFDDVVGNWLRLALRRPLSKSVVRRLIMAGCVRCAGRAVRRPGLEIIGGEAIDILVRMDRLPSPPAHRDPSSLRVLFEDHVLIAVDKPSGLAMHATADPHRLHLVELVRTLIDGTYLGIHQRLDRDTSGVVVFAKDPAVNVSLAEQFAKHTVDKVYHALSARPLDMPGERFLVKAALAPIGRGRSTRMVATASKGHSAETEFQIKETFPNALLVEARPRTGRKHQIRAHLAEAGMPILGDRTYGTATSAVAAPRTMLHATCLTLRHPLTGDRLTIESPYPEDFVRLLHRLRATSTDRRGRDGGRERRGRSGIPRPDQSATRSR